MKRRVLIMVTVLLLVGFAWSKKQDTKKTLSTAPNIVFVFADDSCFGDLGCYGHTEVKTPNIDKFAEQGTRYTQFHVTSGVCSPSRSTLLAGHFPTRHRVHGHFAGNEFNAKRGMPNYLNDSLEVYLPKLMQQAGYKTAHFGKWYLGGGGKPHGDPTAPEPKKYGYDETRAWNGNGPTWKGDQNWPTTRYMDSDTLWLQSSSKLAVNSTIDFIKRTKGKAPFFVNLWLKDLHTPLWPSDEQRKPYKDFTPDKQTYYSVLTDADFHIGRLLDTLSEMGLDENTLIVFTSDNGPAHIPPAIHVGSTGGLKGRKVDSFQGGVDVPFILKWKGHIKPGVIDNQSVLSTVDILPTFQELCQLELPKTYRADGESIASILKNTPFKLTKPLFWECRFSKSSNNPAQENRWPTSIIRKDQWKFLYNEKIQRTELYNIVEDPFEKVNLASENKNKVAILKSLWSDWKQTLPKIRKTKRVV
tara:strand:+ start:21206 stop:22621 length:1416 start_codon:yes stop_codon:yes gene_type:complete